MPKFLVHIHEEWDKVYLVEAPTAEDAATLDMEWIGANLFEDRGGNEEVVEVEEYLK